MKFNFFIASVLVCQSLGFRMLRRANWKERGLSGMERLNKIRMQREGKIVCMHAILMFHGMWSEIGVSIEIHTDFKLHISYESVTFAKDMQHRLQLEINGHCKINEPEKIKIHFDDRSTDLIIY